MSQIDLHVHTTASDGSVSPAGIVDLAKQFGLSAVGITDHDTVEGCREAEEQGLKEDIEVIPGIEFGTRYEGIGMVHILGYFIDIDNKELQDELRFIVYDRDNRNYAIIKKMQEDGIDVDYRAVKDRFGDVIGRPHIAQFLVEHGLAEDTKDAFNRFVGKGMKYWLPRETLALERCIELILNAGGLAVLAHPFEYNFSKVGLEELLNFCIEKGVTGLECRHSSHTAEEMIFLEYLADARGLFKTGGSDFHGFEIKPEIMLGSGKNNVTVPDEWLEIMKERHSR